MASMQSSKEALLNLQKIVYENLKYQHCWSSVELRSENGGRLLPRPLVSGIPPAPIYIHPDAAGQEEDEESASSPTASPSESAITEIVLPLHLEEKVTLKLISEVFDTLPDLGQDSETDPSGKKQAKRVCVAVVSGDSTVVYYFMHDGIVKPRQN